MITGWSWFWYHQGGLSAKEQLAIEQRNNADSLAKAYKEREDEHIAKEKALATENEGLKDNALKYPTVDVRLCKLSIVPAAGKAGQVIPSSPRLGEGNTQQVPSSSGPDYGPSLFGLADKLDKIAAQCRAL